MDDPKDQVIQPGGGEEHIDPAELYALLRAMTTDSYLDTVLAHNPPLADLHAALSTMAPADALDFAIEYLSRPDIGDTAWPDAHDIGHHHHGDGSLF
jgi:hypothetical protein